MEINPKLWHKKEDLGVPPSSESPLVNHENGGLVNQGRFMHRRMKVQQSGTEGSQQLGGSRLARDLLFPRCSQSVLHLVGPRSSYLMHMVTLGVAAAILCKNKLKYRD